VSRLREDGVCAKPYSKEFREGAVALGGDGCRAARVARELGIADWCIRDWIKQDQLDRRERDDGLTSAEREGLRELRKRVRRLEQEKDILRKAAACFARESETRRARSSSSRRRRQTTRSLWCVRSGESPVRGFMAGPSVCPATAISPTRG
jgi:transposase